MVEDLKKQIEKLYDEIEEIQSECSHPKKAVTKKAEGYAGDCGEKGSYWYNMHCKLCDKKWTEPQ